MSISRYWLLILGLSFHFPGAALGGRRLRTLQGQRTIFQVIENDYSNERISDIVKNSSLAQELQQAQNGPYTFFVPSDTGLAQIPDGAPSNFVNLMISDPRFSLHLNDFARFLVTEEGAFQSSDLTDGRAIQMLNGDEIIVQVTGFTSLIGPEGESSATITQTDSSASNGVIYALSGMIWPTLALTDALEVGSVFFRELVVSAGLEDIVRTDLVTMLIPTSAALVALPESVYQDFTLLGQLLRNHIIADVLPSTALTTGTVESIGGDVINIVKDGDTISFNGIPVVKADVLARNGVVHSIDGVIGYATTTPAPVAPTTPAPVAPTAPVAPVTPPPTTSSPSAAPVAQTPSIAQLIANNSDLSTLSGYLVSSGVATRFGSTPSITAFGPNNMAFQQINPEILDRFNSPKWSAHLTSFLLYHGTSDGVYTTTQFTDGMNLTMLNKGTTTINLGNQGSIFVVGSDAAGAAISTGDIEGSNGVLHKLDSVLLPEFFETDLIEALKAGPNDRFSTFLSWIASTNLTEELSTGQYTVLAPTDSAIAKLGTDVIAEITNNPERLTNILKYHFIVDVVPSSQLRNSIYPTENGKNVLRSTCACGLGYKFNDVPVFDADILASNGLIYALDGVLMPPTHNVTNQPTPSPVAPTAPTTTAPTPTGPTPDTPTGGIPPTGPTDGVRAPTSSTWARGASVGTSFSAVFGAVLLQYL